MMRGFTSKLMIRSAVVMALYLAITLLFKPISYNAIQVRISEMLTILPFFFPETIIGLTLGCSFANIFSGFGLYDIIGGSACTLIAALLTYYCSKIKSKHAVYLAMLPPILVNAFGVSLYLTYLQFKIPNNDIRITFWLLYCVNALYILIGQSIAVGIGGTMLVQIIRKWKWAL